jgi:hypothetical protein
MGDPKKLWRPPGPS